MFNKLSTKIIYIFFVLILLMSCSEKKKDSPIVGVWKCTDNNFFCEGEEIWKFNEDNILTLNCVNIEYSLFNKIKWKYKVFEENATSKIETNPCGIKKIAVDSVIFYCFCLVKDCKEVYEYELNQDLDILTLSLITSKSKSVFHRVTKK